MSKWTATHLKVFERKSRESNSQLFHSVSRYVSGDVGDASESI